MIVKQVTSPKQVDIIIPVYNRPEHTKQTLESLFKNTDSSLYNLYVVDDFSTDPEIHKLLYGAAKRFPVFLNEKNIGPGASRNWLCNWITEKKLRSTYLYHSDNDVFFKERWLEKLISTIQLYGNRYKVIGGGCHPYLQSSHKLQLNNLN
ncbi:MAG TPA: glycosyltransferase family 2 protein, partial [bacterium]|nr:glycosyltransferase family 2 protein [bacterium]